MPFSTKSVTLIELIISVTIVSVIILSIYSIDNFSRNQVINSERRVKVQNELAYTLEHMGKYVQQAIGNVSDPGNLAPAIEYFPPGNPSGFRVRVDFNQTPSNLNDDPWIRYRLVNPNTIRVSCSGGCPASFINEDLITRVLNANGFINPIPAILPDPPTDGFYATIGDNGSSVEVVLIGRFRPDENRSLRNPEAVMRTRLICNSCSTN